MALDVGGLADTILGAMKGVFDQQWPQMKDYATGESQKLASSLVQITTLSVSGQISPGECNIMLEMQKNATRSVLLALEGMGLILVEMAINAALSAVKDAVNGAIGFALL